MTDHFAPQRHEVLPKMAEQLRLAQQPLLATRFFPPPLPRVFVPRPRLMDHIRQGLRVPLTLISAPPGFGKSSLIRQWIQDEPDLASGWLSLEPTDQEWTIFFRYLVAAWQQIYPHAGESALTYWRDDPAARRQTLLNLLLNDLLTAQDQLGDSHALLVLDDYHRIETTEIHEMVTYLLEHLPSRCHMALLTRADPPLPLARWRSRGMLLEVRADDLRFTPVEAVAYLNQGMRLGLAEEQVLPLLDRTEGWITGLQMAALSLQVYQDGRLDADTFVRAFDGSNRFVLDYLVEEVISAQPEEVQLFLLSTTILDQFCGPLCDALLETPAPTSQRMLERLEKANMFLIPLDDRRTWFRYHHLFADLLRLRLSQTLPEQGPILLHRAADWFAQNGLWTDAVRYALQTKDLEFSARLFEQAVIKGGLDFLFSGIGPLLEPLPQALVESRPLLSLAKAEIILSSHRLEGIEPLLRFAEQGIRTTEPFPGQEGVLGMVYLLQAEAATQLGDHAWLVEANQRVRHWTPKDFVFNVERLVQFGFAAYYEGDLNQTEAYWQQAYDLSQARKNTYYMLAMLNCLGRINFQKGDFKRSEAFFQQAFDLTEQHSGQYLIWLGANQRDYADLLRECNRLEEALALASSAIPLLAKWHTVGAVGYGYYTLARTLLVCGDLKSASEWLDRLDELNRRYTLYPDLKTLAKVIRARVYLEEGLLQAAEDLLDDCLASSHSQYPYIREWALIPKTRLLIRSGRPAEALDLLSGLMESAKAGGRGRSWLSFCLLTALARYALGDRQVAYDLLTEGLTYGQANGHKLTLIEEGQPLRALLEAFQVQFPRSPLATYVSDLLLIFPALPKEEISVPQLVDGLYESLSPRELEILRLVCQGLSNQEIAHRLVLSVGTVKFHIHNIFGKLDVRDRPQAIAKVVQLGL